MSLILFLFIIFSELLSQEQNLRSLVSFVCKTFLYFSFKALATYSVRYIFPPPELRFLCRTADLSMIYVLFFLSLSPSCNAGLKTCMEKAKKKKSKVKFLPLSEVGILIYS